MFLLRTLLAQGSLQIAARRGTPVLYGGGAPLVRLYLHRDLPWQPWRRPECRLIEAYRRHHLTIVGGTLRDLHYLFYLNRAASKRNPVWQAMLWLERLAYPASLDQMIELDRMFGFHGALSCRLARRRDGGRQFRLRRTAFRGALRVRRRPNASRTAVSHRIGTMVTSPNTRAATLGSNGAAAFMRRAASPCLWLRPALVDATPTLVPPLRATNRRSAGQRLTPRAGRANRPRTRIRPAMQGWMLRSVAGAPSPSDRWIRIETN